MDEKPSLLSGTDPDGLGTLELFAHAPRFNRWLFRSVSPYCSGSLLEIGSGIGNISDHLLGLGIPVTLSDLREEYCAYLNNRFRGEKGLHAVRRLDLAEPDFEKKHPELLQQFDTIVALNVVEHIGDDLKAVTNCRKMLRPGGKLVVLVPAYGMLFNRFDQMLGHYRRYNKNSLEKLLETGGLRVERSWYFNLAGIPGWWISGSLLGNRRIPKAQLRLYEALVPLFRLADILTGRRIGLSVIAVGNSSTE